MISHRLPLKKLGAAYRALSKKYILDGKEVLKAVIAPWDKKNRPKK